MNRQEVAALLERIKVRWPHTTWDATLDVVLDVWCEDMADLPAEAVRATVADLGGERFAPAPGMLRTAVLDRIDPDPTPDLDQAWLEVGRGVHRWGFYSTAVEREWSHPAVAEAVAAFGWQELCESENPDAARAHFGRYYAATKARHRVSRSTPAVAEALGRARDGLAEVRRLAERLALPDAER